MNLGKEELDAMLRGWPAPAPGKDAPPPKREGKLEAEDDEVWAARAAAVTQKAMSAGAFDNLDALLAPPTLAAEAGEPVGAGEPIKISAGEAKMSDEKDPPEAPASIPAPAMSRRGSLKAMAERASQAGAGRASNPGAAPTSSPPPPRTPVPSSVASVSSRPPPSISSASSRGSVPPVSRPVEADKDDSGAINLGAIQAAATAAEKAAAEKAKPASADLFADDEKAPKATKKPVVAAVAPLPAPKKGGNGAIAGVAIAVLGVAAAFFIMQSKKPAAPVPTQPAAEVKTSKVEAPVAKVEAPAAPTATAASTGKSIDDLPTAGSADPAKDPAKAVAVGPAPTGGGPGGPVATATAAASAKEAPGDKVAAKPAGSGKPGDLVSEMEKRVGKDGSAKGGGEEVVMGPANGPSNQNVPEQPSQGAIAAAKSSVMAGAKACVAGADDVSQATVTFGSNGTVSSVSVSGWAAANGASACVKAALKGAKVGAFSKPSYSFPVTIRP